MGISQGVHGDPQRSLHHNVRGVLSHLQPAVHACQRPPLAFRVAQKSSAFALMLLNAQGTKNVHMYVHYIYAHLPCHNACSSVHLLQHVMTFAHAPKLSKCVPLFSFVPNKKISSKSPIRQEYKDGATSLIFAMTRRCLSFASLTSSDMCDARTEHMHTCMYDTHHGAISRRGIQAHETAQEDPELRHGAW
jgi:hypothetical protein